MNEGIQTALGKYSIHICKKGAYCSSPAEAIKLHGANLPS